MVKEVSICCRECGISANVLTCLLNFGQRPNQLAFTTSTFYKGECQCCGKFDYVTQARDFFYPDFSLLPKVAKLIHKYELQKEEETLEG